MRHGLLIALTLLAPAAAHATATTTTWALTFDGPAQAGGEVAVDVDGWALLVLADTSAFTLGLPGPSTTVNHTSGLFTGEAPRVSGSSGSVPLPDVEGRLDGPVQAALRFTGPGSVYVRAQHLRVTLHGADVELRASAVGEAPFGSLVADGTGPPGVARHGAHGLPADGVALVGAHWDLPSQVEVAASGLLDVEWHDAEVACATRSCPDGARSFPADAFGLVGATMLPYLQVMPDGGTFAGAGKVAALAVGGPGLDAAVEGWIRLPGAQAIGPCAGCTDPAGSTYYAEGGLGLGHLRRDGDRLAADLGGSPTRVRLGEQWTPLASAAAATVGLVAVALAAKAIALALGARVSRGQADAHPARQRLLEVARSRPGVGLRQAFRAAGLPYATGLHHLAVLRRHAMITLVRQGRRLHVFVGDPGPAPPVAAEDAAIGALHDLLLAGAVAFQSDVVAHARTAWGWKASTTRHRLGRLARKGLVERRGMGRRVAYVATSPASLRVALPLDPGAQAHAA